MPVPQRLPQISILRTRHPDLGEVIFPHESKQQEGIIAVGLPFLHSLRLDLCRITHPNLDAQFVSKTI